MANVRAVELFCGIGGFRIACDSLGIQTVWANDLNELSCEVYRNAFGDEEVVQGDIRALHDRIPEHDLLTAGFPCQPFSSAGKKLGTRDPRGTLFEEIVEILDSHSPKWFVLENVKRLLTMENGDHFATILKALSELDYAIEWKLLNAASFGLPQNRQRVVITGSLIKDFRDVPVSLLSDLELFSLVRDEYEPLKDSSSWRFIEHHNRRFPEWGLCYKGRFFIPKTAFPGTESIDCSLTGILQRDPPEDFYMDESTKDRLRTSVFINKLVDGVRILYNQKGGARMGYTVFGTDGIAPALTASHSRHYERYKIGSRYRRLTNVEYARLQGFPDDHCAVTTVFNQYGLYGNAVPPPMVKWVIKRMTQTPVKLISELEPVPNSQMRLEL